MSFEEIIAGYRDLAERPFYETVRQWKEEDWRRKAVGLFPVYAPAEIIHAAGLLPVATLGGGNQIEIVHADSRFQSFICSIVKSTLELGLRGDLKALDGLIFQSICDSARNLSALFKRNFPTMFVDYIHLPQSTEMGSAVEYFYYELSRIKTNLEAFFGRPATEESLRASLRLYNHQRALYWHIYEVRKNSPQLISAAETYILLRGGGVLPPEEHNQSLELAVAAIGHRQVKPRDRIRVVVEGACCEQMPLELIQLIEEAGCYVVDDDLLIGWRLFTQDVPEEGDPLRALAESYLRHSYYSSIRHDWRQPRFQGLLEKVKGSRADAVIFCIAKFCEPVLFDYVPFKEELEKAGIPHLLLEFEEKMWTFERIRGEVETFVESILFD